MMNFKADYKLVYFFLIEFAVVVVFSFWSPLGDFRATPKFWRDEAIPFEIARTYAELGTLDVVVAPNVPFNLPYMTHATGFPVTIPLALFFKIFGVGVAQSRIYMVLWICVTVVATFFVFRRLLGFQYAVAATLFISTFPPFYANGRTSTGEIPGFFFLLLALYFVYAPEKKRNAFGGFFLALAAVSKPSVYLLVFPAIVLEICVSDWRIAFRRLVSIAWGALPVIVFWIYVILPNPFHIEQWKRMGAFYANAINEPSLIAQLPKSLFFLLGQSTLWYVALLCGVMIVSYRSFVSRDAVVGRLVAFSFSFGIFSFLYFMRSPGWLRYLLPFELLLLALVIPSLEKVLDGHGFPKSIARLVCVLILMLHVGTFFFMSNIQSSMKSIRTAETIVLLLRKEPRATIGIIFETPVAALIPPDRKYQIATIGGRGTVMGENPLLLPPQKLPDYIYGAVTEHREILERYYEDSPVGVENLYQKKR